MGPDERWVGIGDVAAHLGVGKVSIYRWVERRGLLARRVLRFKLSQVDAWVEARVAKGHGSESSLAPSTSGPAESQGQKVGQELNPLTLRVRRVRTGNHDR